jgi:hypothetical protein
MVDPGTEGNIVETRAGLGIAKKGIETAIGPVGTKQVVVIVVIGREADLPVKGVSLADGKMVGEMRGPVPGGID